MKRICLWCCLALSLHTAFAQKINVAAAANLRYVLEAIKASYVKKYPGTVLNITFGSSGTLVQQIANGASFDLFLSADTEFPQKLKEKGLTVGPLVTYAYGKLALYSTTIDVSKLGTAALNDPSVRKIALANPETAPYGERSVEWMKRMGLYDKLKGRFVLAENISQAAQFAYSGNAEIGFVALSLTLGPEMADKGYCYVVPEDQYAPIEQSAVLVRSSVFNTQAARFRNYLLSAEVRPLWLRYGYNVPSLPKAKKR